MTLVGINMICWNAGCSASGESGEDTGSAFSAATVPYAECAEILKGDLFNRISSNQASTEADRTMGWQTLLSMSEDEAYSRYLKAYEQARETGGGGGFSLFKIFSIKGNAGVKRKLSRTDFGEVYHQMKTLNASSTGYDFSHSASFTSAYASAIRDPQSVEAWRDCVMKPEQPGLYAYGFRDGVGNAYVDVMWAPQNFGWALPRIKISFVRHDGFTVDAPAEDVLEVGTKSYAVRTTNASRELMIKVNGLAYDAAGSGRNNFQADAAIPPTVVLPTIKMLDECEQRRLLGYFGDTVTKERLEAMRKFSQAPLHEVEEDSSTRVIAYYRCSP